MVNTCEQTFSLVPFNVLTMILHPMLVDPNHLRHFTNCSEDNVHESRLWEPFELTIQNLFRHFPVKAISIHN